jgi:Major Facilitator Superfamily
MLDPAAHCPVLAGWLAHTSLGLPGTFVIAALACAGAVVFTVVAALLTPDGRRSTDLDQNGEPRAGLWRTSGTIVRSPAGPWLLVIALFACLFTTMTQFQTTFAGARGLDNSIFYVGYTIAVIAVRFLVAPWVRRFNQALVVAIAITAYRRSGLRSPARAP